MTGQKSYTTEEAAAVLGGPFTVNWLRGHLDEIPHLRVGAGRGNSGRVGFSEAHLDRILAMFTVEPEPGTKPGDFTPISRRRTA